MFFIFIGICVAAPLEVPVVKDIFLSVYVPYSVVRGEQIELKGSVYNHRDSPIKVICGLSDFYISPGSIQDLILGSDFSILQLVLDVIYITV